MRLIVSFFLSVIIYFLIIVFFVFFLFKENKTQEVLVHTAIVPKTSSLKNNTKTTKKKTVFKQVKKTVKKIEKPKKIGSKTNLETGGDVTFDDIFKNVKTNVPTTPVKLKKSEMSRFKGIKRIEKNLKNVKLLNINISYQNKSDIKKGDVDLIIAKISKVWYEISNIPGEYAKINVINNNGNIDVVILDSNLDRVKQLELINMIKQLKFDKNFNLNILFQTKVNK